MPGNWSKAPAWRAVLASAIPAAASALLVRAWLEIGYAPLAVMLDALLLFPVVLASAVAARWRWQPWVTGACLGALFVVGSAYKAAMMGVPLSPTDASAAMELVQVLSGWRLALTAVAAIAWTGLLLLSLYPRPSRRAAWLLLPVVWVFLLIAVPMPLSRTLQSLEGKDVAHGTERLEAQGSIAYLLRAVYADRDEMAEVPRRAQVAAAIAALGIEPRTQPTPPSAPRRPIHVVLLESLWDARALEAYDFSSPPLDPRFIEAWNAGGHSGVLSPVFGGATANAEFEFLCGLPSLRATIVFGDALRNPVPCLPRILREAGYESVAIHPHRASFWSRDQAYPLLGFESYRPLGTFEMDDMDGMFLADASTFRQVREWGESTSGGKTRFIWLVSLGSHYPFDRDRTARPDLVKVTPEAPLLEAYANATRYTTAAFMDYVESVLAREPDALIVAFGDHAPVLGTNPDPFARSGIDTRDEAGLARMATTPLLVIDGRNGPVAMGDLPLHELAARVLALLGEGHPLLPHASWGGHAAPASNERLFLNHLLHRHGDGRWRDCSSIARPECKAARLTRSHLVVLRDDLIRGNQYALELLNAAGYAATPEMRTVRKYAACVVEVESWGPQWTSAGQAFNVQPDGHSAFWFSLRVARGSPSLRFAGQEVPMTLVGEAGSAGFASVPEVVGDYPLDWVCDDGSEGRIGTFTVVAATSP